MICVCGVWAKRPDDDALDAMHKIRGAAQMKCLRANETALARPSFMIEHEPCHDTRSVGFCGERVDDVNGFFTVLVAVVGGTVDLLLHGNQIAAGELLY